MIRDICMLMIGAGLVCVGQLAHALVERLKYGKARHPHAQPASRARSCEPKAPPAPPTPIDQRNAKDAIAALTGLGYTSPIAHAAVQAAIDKLGATASPENLTRQALRECPKAHGASA